ncbi:MAG TPA: glycosyltransferase family 2 protein [Flavitalea sp.]|nr:glycosyltransferase family 2 protein [Flavitalea sp.]
MQLSIIIVNYKTPQLVVDCLRTVFEQTKTIEFEVIVVDNASGNHNRDMIITEFPSVKWIEMDYNAGFARANNEGIRKASGNVILLLNSDTLNENNAIENCYLDFSKDECLACGVQLLNPDRTPQISGNYFMTGGLNNLLSLTYIGKLIKGIGHLFNIKKPNISETNLRVEVDWINGAFLMVKKNAISQAGLLDEDFFLYAEEAEWCGRIRRYGKCCIYGRHHVIHLQGESAGSAFSTSEKGYKTLHDRKGLQIMLSNFVRLKKQFGTGWFFLQLLLYTAEVPVFFILRFFENIIRLRNLFNGFRDGSGYAANIFRLWKYVPHIVSGKPFFYKVL